MGTTSVHGRGLARVQRLILHIPDGQMIILTLFEGQGHFQQAAVMDDVT